MPETVYFDIHWNRVQLYVGPAVIHLWNTRCKEIPEGTRLERVDMARLAEIYADETRIHPIVHCSECFPKYKPPRTISGNQCPKGCYLVGDPLPKFWSHEYTHASRAIGVTVWRVYDGVLFWKCPDCGCRWHVDQIDWHRRELAEEYWANGTL